MQTSQQTEPMIEGPELECDGYRSLRAAVEKDIKGNGGHDYRRQLRWVVDRAKHYAEKTGLTPEAILDAWESQRNYWYMNYYQESKQPEIKGDKVRVFDTVSDLLKSIGEMKFRCPSCSGVSTSAYACDAGNCDWKACGLFGTLGKGVTVFVKEKLTVETVFMPLAWEVKDGH